MRILIFTKSHFSEQLLKYLPPITEDFAIYTIDNEKLAYKNELKFDLGVSYCYGRKITEPLLSRAKQGFINFHPAPLPKYAGGDPYSMGVKDKVREWGVTAHYMTGEYDKGEIIKNISFPLFHPPINRDELGALAHYFNFQLFLKVIVDIVKDKSMVYYL